MEMLRRSSVFAAEVFDRSPTDKELVSQAKALCRDYIHSRLNRAGVGWSKADHGLAASGGTLGEVSSVLMWLVYDPPLEYYPHTLADRRRRLLRGRQSSQTPPALKNKENRWGKREERRGEERRGGEERREERRGEERREERRGEERRGEERRGEERRDRGETMTQWGDRGLSGAELEYLRPNVYCNVARQLNITVASESIMSDAFLAVAADIFSTGVTWGKVVSLYAVAGALAVDCVRHGHPAMIHTIVDCMGEFVRKSLISWLKRRGGWVDVTKCVVNMDPNFHSHWLMSALCAFGNYLKTTVLYLLREK
ncbi:Bcl-2-related ovarian killer protein -like protein A [Takifugu flavidus]|uniref:Bcl-2-related ovarian killer protein-like protein A n=1 Tax=Takifugu flavidus TaxID=433684 RepID=A0A5C6MVP1_9TELE|nr:Bcl-2-related ovarian killer protein -like protein A [Takifugu flavidus]